MQASNGKHETAEFLCPDCGYINQVGAPMLNEKYREHQLKCQQCGHLLEIVVADGMHNNINIIASSVDPEKSF